MIITRVSGLKNAPRCRVEDRVNPRLYASEPLPDSERSFSLEDLGIEAYKPRLRSPGEMVLCAFYPVGKKS